MTRWRSLAFLCALLSAAALLAGEGGKVTGTFLVGGSDAQLKYVRAKRATLDEKGKAGYAVLLSANPATGDIESWRTAEPSKNGSFIVLMLEANGQVWVGELGHAKAKSGRFGVVTELQKVSFEVRDHHLVAHVRTDGEQAFGDDHYRVDLTFDAPLEER